MSNNDDIAPPAAPEPSRDPELEEKKKEAEPADAELFEAVKGKWQTILERSQEKNRGLPYMLGAAVLLGVEDGTLRVGFQYAMYRDRLNGKCKRMLEEVLSETIKTDIRVRGELVEKDDAPAGEDRRLPDGFADLVNEFGGSTV